jgi:hypothetical protein
MPGSLLLRSPQYHDRDHGPTTQKVTVARPKNCNSISFQRQDDPSNWATIAYNLGT